MLKYWYLFIMSGTLLVACTQQALIDQNISINGEAWHYKQTLDTSFNISDTTRAYHIYFNLRNSNNYPYQNLYILSSIYPDDSTTKPTLKRYQFAVANEDGAWLGSGSGALYSIRFPLEKNYKFAKAGKYHIHVEQNMRDNPLNGVADIGFSVEPTEKN